MRLLFVILAHERPEEAAALARALVGGASDARALVHFDARAGAAPVEAFRAAAAGEPRIEALDERVATPWGEWGLVAAPLAALRRAEAMAGTWDWTADRVVLLSGACLPCRPLGQLERFLSARPQTEFIEVEDQAWITGGLRSERWKLWFPFNFRTQYRLHRAGVGVQRLLGVSRRFPKGLTPRFGSQWWCLTWETCAAMLAYARAHPERMRFFERVWIPDEMAVQTLVHALVPARRIFGRGLTHFQFTDKGKPVVHHDDHLDYVMGLDAFFFRKAAPGATRLRAACLELASAGPKRFGTPVARDGRDTSDYALKVRAQAGFPMAGRPFHAAQAAPAADAVLGRARTPYTVVVGPPARTRAVLARLGEAGLVALGEAFAPGWCDLGEGREVFEGMRPEHWRIRDMHPALWLARLAGRGGGRTALGWSPLHAPALLGAVLRDPRAVVVNALPRTGDEDDDLVAFAEACADEAHHGSPPSARLGVDPVARVRAWLDEAGARNLWRQLALGPGDAGTDATRATLLAMPWAPDPDRLADARRRSFEASLLRLDAASRPAGEAVRAGLQAAWADWHAAGAPAREGAA